MGSPVWSRDGISAVADAHKGKVKLTFDHGAKLPALQKLLSAGLEGGQGRAIGFFEDDRVDGPALQALVRAALELVQAKKKKPASRAKPKD